MNIHQSLQIELQEIKNRFNFNNNENDEIIIHSWTECDYTITGNLHPHHFNFINWAE